ncbi:cell-division initiation protein [Bacillus sp. OxB-1]|uniref:FtsB family cell division protein n=1 Tax=Bacillus sp. (strain OxB-1) TaxID=98228 RepID=UPI000581E036|nr:septum formation initiator family protein [Bacillus sp. OxB-1]BAQ09509.1 cell-division initiation protein [Bacillus sp. OxB-1]
MEERSSRATVASIQTEYVRNLQKQQQRKAARKVRLFRRLAILGIISAIFFGALIHTHFKQKQVLADKEQQKAELTVQLQEVQAEQELLEKQLVKLDDDEYIAKLARKEYFLSDRNEIIFSIPEKHQKKDGNMEGKE